MKTAEDWINIAYTAIKVGHVRCSARWVGCICMPCTIYSVSVQLSSASVYSLYITGKVQVQLT